LAVHVESIADAIYNHPFSASSIAPTSKVSAEKIKAITDDLTLLTAVEGAQLRSWLLSPAVRRALPLLRWVLSSQEGSQPQCHTLKS
jgi:hypothetical protein